MGVVKLFGKYIYAVAVVSVFVEVGKATYNLVHNFTTGKLEKSSREA